MKELIQLLKFLKPKRVFIEGWLYWYTAFGTGMETYLASEESYKYINPKLRFWLIMLIGSSVGGFNAVKAFRSMTYGRAYNESNNLPLNPQPTQTNEKVS